MLTIYQKDSNHLKIWETSNTYLKINLSGAPLPISSSLNLKRYSKLIPLCGTTFFVLKLSEELWFLSVAVTEVNQVNVIRDWGLESNEGNQVMLFFKFAMMKESS